MAVLRELIEPIPIEQQQREEQAEVAVAETLALLRAAGVIEVFGMAGTDEECEEAFVAIAKSGHTNLAIDKIPDALFGGIDKKIAADTAEGQNPVANHTPTHSERGNEANPGSDSR
jgi:hypothetical protein